LGGTIWKDMILVTLNEMSFTRVEWEKGIMYPTQKNWDEGSIAYILDELFM